MFFLQFISIEHLLLAAQAVDPFVKSALQNMKCTSSALKDAVKDIRGSSKVDSRSAESKYEALKKYSVDLTQAARDSKLDPVIGNVTFIPGVVLHASSCLANV